MMLHVAALPFPSHQGTQAVIRTMLECFARMGRDHQLLTYASSGYDYDPPFALHRLGDFPRVRSLRSGPSAGKLLLDARLALGVRQLQRRLRPTLTVTHHVEAAAATGRGNLFFAHTDLGGELPDYTPAALAPLARRAGAQLDRLLVRRASATATISPLLAERLSRAHPERTIVHVPPPWPVPKPGPVREAARAALGLDADERVVLYAGNLDRYQGVSLLIELLARAPRLRLLLATGADTAAFVTDARRAGVAERITLASLHTEAARACVHAAADAVVVPRRAPGGLPIKLLDAMARGKACVVTPRSAAGLALNGAALCSADDSAEAVAQRIEELFDDASRRGQLADAAREYVRREHSDARFVEAFDAVADAARTGVKLPT